MILWDVVSGRELRALEGHKGTVLDVAFSPDGARLASVGKDATVRIWDSAGGGEVQTLTAHEGAVQGVAYSPDGIHVASAGADGTVRLWGVASGRELQTLTGHGAPVNKVAFSRNGSRLASAGDDGTVRLWDMPSGRELHVLRGHQGAVKSIAFSPDGARLACRGEDGTVRLWDVANGQEVQVLRGDKDNDSDVAFSPDGTRLVFVEEPRILRTGQLPGTLRVWDARPRTPEITAEREAHGLVHLLAAQPLLKAEILASLRANKAISQLVRKQALRLAESIRDDPDRLNYAAWEIVSRPGRAAAAYAQALQAMQTVCRQNPDGRDSLGTMGAALYRIGRYQEALTTLARSEVLNTAAEKKSNAVRDIGCLLMSPWLVPLTGIFTDDAPPDDIAFLAMTRHRLGQTAHAQADLARLRKILQQDRWATWTEAAALLHEAESVLQTKPGENRP